MALGALLMVPAMNFNHTDRLSLAVALSPYLIIGYGFLRLTVRTSTKIDPHQRQLIFHRGEILTSKVSRVSIPTTATLEVRKCTSVFDGEPLIRYNAWLRLDDTQEHFLDMFDDPEPAKAFANRVAQALDLEPVETILAESPR